MIKQVSINSASRAIQKQRTESAFESCTDDNLKYEEGPLGRCIIVMPSVRRIRNLNGVLQ